MKDVHVALIFFFGVLILIAIVIVFSMNDASIQEATLDCMNSAIHANRSMSVEEAAKICWRG